MDALNKLTNLFLYGGLDRERYEKVHDAVLDENLNNLKYFTIYGSIISLALPVASFVTQSHSILNAPVYLLSSLAMVMLGVCAWVFAPRHRGLIMPLVRVFKLMLYLFAILISMQHLEYPSVSISVFLVLVPLLFLDRPINLAIMTTIVCGASIMVSNATKAPEIVRVDTWNIITFGILALIANVLLMRTKFRTLYQAEWISYIGQMDILTGIRNRNSYEQTLDARPELLQPETICAYADANGLHELNDTKGHEAGDEMLQTIAREFGALFEPELTFRVGGDEFVGFRTDGDLAQTIADLKSMQERVMAHGYNVSVGAAQANEADVANGGRSVVRRAEQQMYNDKVEYYKLHDRRRH